ncbi:hypothetical protein ACUOH3_03530 [Escherichia coli]
MKRYTHDLETDLNDVDKTPSLIHKTLLTASTIYDLKYLAQVLNDENGSNWSRASLKRQVTCIPEHCELSIADGRYLQTLRHCCKVSDEAAFCLIQRPYISKTLLTRRISPRGSP